MSQTFRGMNIVSSSAVPEKQPAIQLSPDCPCSEEFRERFDANMLKLFGEKTCFYVMGSGLATKIVMNPINLQKLKKAAPPPIDPITRGYIDVKTRN